VNWTLYLQSRTDLCVMLLIGVTLGYYLRKSR
jgi:hypothetical protein